MLAYSSGRRSGNGFEWRISRWVVSTAYTLSYTLILRKHDRTEEITELCKQNKRTNIWTLKYGISCQTTQDSWGLVGAQLHAWQLGPHFKFTENILCSHRKHIPDRWNIYWLIWKDNVILGSCTELRRGYLLVLLGGADPAEISISAVTDTPIILVFCPA